MRKILLPALFILFIFARPLVLPAQTVLKPSIGLTAVPKDTAPICSIPLAIDPTELFDVPGLHAGDTVPDFKLYMLNNDSVQLSELLTDKKPVLLIVGSYTCPKYRNTLKELNDLQATYGSQVHIFIIYTVEAHPDSPDISPYKGAVWELNQNDKNNIHYHEPKTYQDRKNAATDMLNNLDIEEPVLLDGPCNLWWESYAMAPNSAFLINPNGTIYLKQGWFDNSLYTVSYAIDSLLQKVTTGLPPVSQTAAVVTDLSSAATIRFTFSKPLEHAQLMLFDALGRQAEAPNLFSGNTFELSKQHLARGIYFYTIQSIKANAQRKVSDSMIF